MPRSPVLTGRTQPRDRARQRGRLDRQAPAAVRGEAVAGVRAWLDASGATGAVASIETIDLAAFVRQTAHLGASSEERLRQLAIALEHEIAWRRDEQPRAWLALDRIYAAALRLNPDEVGVHLSRAISARECAEGLWAPGVDRGAWARSPLRRRMATAAREACLAALERAPSDADALHVMGDQGYFDPDRGASEALPWYERALAADPTHTWAALYRAHCLHDLARWEEAAAAYDAVDPSAFVGPKAWRYEHLLEQRAHCRLQAGDVGRARAEFEALLTRWERDPTLVRDVWGEHLAEAAQGPLRDALFDRTLALCRRADEAHASGAIGVGRLGTALLGES